MSEANILPADIEQEYERLLRFVTRPGPRFGLGLVRGSSRWDWLRERLERDVGHAGRRIGTVVFTRDDAKPDFDGLMLVKAQLREPMIEFG